VTLPGEPPEKRTIVLSIPGEPFSLKRPRAVRVGAFVRIHDPHANATWKGNAALFMSSAMAGQAPLAGPVALEVCAYFSCPKSQESKRSPRPERWSMNAKDLDNIVKAVGDAGNGVLWLDDRQIASVCARKRVAAQGQPARTEIVVRELGD